MLAETPLTLLLPCLFFLGVLIGVGVKWANTLLDDRMAEREHRRHLAEIEAECRLIEAERRAESLYRNREPHDVE